MFDKLFETKTKIVPCEFRCEPDGTGLKVEVFGTPLPGEVEIRLGYKTNDTLWIDKNSATILAKFFTVISETL